MSERLSVPPLPASADSYEILRDCRAYFLQRLTAILGTAGAIPASAIDAAARGAGDFFDDMAAARRAGFEQADGLTASRISLVGDDQLELEILLGDTVKRLSEAGAADLWRLYLRFATLLQRPDLARGDNPVGAEAIACGLGEMCSTLGGGIDQWAPLVERVEQQLARQLPALYGDLNEQLAGQRIDPAQLPGGGASKPAAPGSPQTVATTDALAALQRTLLGQQAPAAAETTTAVPVDLLNRLLVRLETLERQERPEAAASQEGILRTVTPDQLGLPAAAPEAAAIDALAMIFAAIFDDTVLPDPIRAAIASLQIPVLKVAILDPGFFSTPTHPVRLFLDRMARAALGLPREAGPDHPVCASLRDVAADLRTRCDGTPAVFAQSLAGLEALIARRNRDIQCLAETYQPLVAEQERRDLAAARAAEALAPSLAARPPAAIAAFLAGHWQRRLQAAWLDQGEDGDDWREALVVATDLLWSIQPKDGPEDRRRLAQLVPGLLRRVGAGLDRIDVTPEARAPFLDACFTLQTAAIRPWAASAEGGTNVAVTADPALAPAPQPEAGEIRAAGLTLRTLALPGRSPGAIQPSWGPGDWLEFTLPETGKVCGRLCGISPATGWPLFANPDWGYGVTLSPALLERQLRSGEAALRGAASFFDAAAGKALQLLV